MKNGFLPYMRPGLLDSLIVWISLNLPCIFWRSSKLVCRFPCVTWVESTWGFWVTDEISTKGKKAGNGADRTAWTYVPSWRNGCQERNRDGIHDWMQGILDTPRFLPENAKTRGKKQVPQKQRQIQRVIRAGRRWALKVLTCKENQCFKKYPAVFVSFRNEDHGPLERALVKLLPEEKLSLNICRATGHNPIYLQP